MEGEINNLILVWSSAILSLYHCYVVSKAAPKGILRLIFILPVICLFSILPLHALKSFHLGYATVFCLSWVANFKLLLLSFGTGPLSDSSLSLSHFIAIACLPILLAQEDPTKDAQKKMDGQDEKVGECKRNGLKSFSHYAIEAMSLPLVVLLYAYRESMHPNMLIFFYMLFVYAGLEFVLALCAIIAQSLSGLELEHPFNQPLLSTSLGDYWGKRWNLISTNILRLTIFRPIYKYVSKILGRTWAWFFAIMATFLVSGLMHELLNYYVFRTNPNWGYTYYFLIQGLCVVVEGDLKKKFAGRWQQPPRLVLAPIVLGFTMTTFAWLVMVDLMQKNIDTLVMKEYLLICEFLMSSVGLGDKVLPLANRVFGTLW